MYVKPKYQIITRNRLPFPLSFLLDVSEDKAERREREEEDGIILGLLSERLCVFAQMDLISIYSLSHKTRKRLHNITLNPLSVSENPCGKKTGSDEMIREKSRS